MTTKILMETRRVHSDSLIDAEGTLFLYHGILYTMIDNAFLFRAHNGPNTGCIVVDRWYQGHTGKFAQECKDEVTNAMKDRFPDEEIAAHIGPIRFVHLVEPERLIQYR